MYAPLLSNRYLRSRVIPLIAVAAVALCVALVIIVVSVMSGFLEMVRQAGRQLNGDVIISYPINGIPGYERLAERLEAMPEVSAVAPLVDGWGLLRMPYPDGDEKAMETVQFWAVEPESFDRVTGFLGTLHWTPVTDGLRRTLGSRDFRRDLEESIGNDELATLVDEAAALRTMELDRAGALVPRPGTVLGLHVSKANRRQEDGSVRPVTGHRSGSWWMPRFEVILSTLPPRTNLASPQAENVRLRVVNEFRTGLYMIDETRIIIPLEEGQRIMHLDAQALVDPVTGQPTGLTEPKRATQLLIRAAPGIHADALKPLVEATYDAYREAFIAERNNAAFAPPTRGVGLVVQTWREQQARFIEPVEKERELMRTLFSLIYLVTAGLVLAIFWAIVHEKTRDIGVLRSVGASRAGICWIFLRYGFQIGVLGAIAGLGLGALIVRNINAIHGAMGHPPIWLGVFLGIAAVGSAVVAAWRSRGGALLPLVLGGTVALALGGLAAGVFWVRFVIGGIQIWDPAVYYFSTIPNQLDPVACISTMIGAVIFSVLGAFFPAASAADIDPVRALRYE